MLNKPKLTLRKPTPADPVKIALSLQIGHRFVDRSGRYILQHRVAIYVDTPEPGGRFEHTWVDIPLVPETYGEAKA